MRVVDEADLERLQAKLDGIAETNAERFEEWRGSLALADEDDADELFEAAALLAKVREEMRGLFAGLASVAERVEREHEFERWREERRRSLEAKRRRSIVITEEAALAGLRSALGASGKDHETAGNVARALGALPTHIDRVRAGIALSRLARRGKVIRHAPRDPSHGTCRWSLT